MVKTGLKSRDVKKDHFSSGVNANDPKCSRLVVRILDGTNLLASDIETGTSDPICFVWCGFDDETPDAMVSPAKSPTHEDKLDETLGDTEKVETRWLTTSVAQRTTNPIWNEDIVFPIDASDIMSLANMKMLIFVRDEDLHPDGATTYDDLGMIEYSIMDLLLTGRAMQNSIVKSAASYELKKSPGMKRLDGSIKLTLSLIFVPEDSAAITEQLQATDLINSANPLLRQGGVAQMLQQVMKASRKDGLPSIAQSSRVSTRSARPQSANSLRSSDSSVSLQSSVTSQRPSSAKLRMDSSSSRGHRIQGIASPVKRRVRSAPIRSESPIEEDEMSEPELLVVPPSGPPAKNKKQKQRYQPMQTPSIVLEEDEQVADIDEAEEAELRALEESEQRLDDDPVLAPVPEPMVVSRLEEGTRVEINYRGQGKYFSGTISKDRGDCYDIAYDDGDTETRVIDENIHVMSLNRLEPGTKVEVNYREQGKYYPGKVSKDVGSGYDIAYDDGDTEQNVKEVHIRVLPKPSDLLDSGPMGGDEFIMPELLNAGAQIFRELDLVDVMKDGAIGMVGAVATSMKDRGNYIKHVATRTDVGRLAKTGIEQVGRAATIAGSAAMNAATSGVNNLKKADTFVHIPAMPAMPAMAKDGMQQVGRAATSAGNAAMQATTSGMNAASSGVNSLRKQDVFNHMPAMPHMPSNVGGFAVPSAKGLMNNAAEIMGGAVVAMGLHAPRGKMIKAGLAEADAKAADDKVRAELDVLRAQLKAIDAAVQGSNLEEEHRLVFADQQKALAARIAQIAKRLDDKKPAPATADSKDVKDTKDSKPDLVDQAQAKDAKDQPKTAEEMKDRAPHPAQQAPSKDLPTVVVGGKDSKDDKDSKVDDPLQAPRGDFAEDMPDEEQGGAAGNHVASNTDDVPYEPMEELKEIEGGDAIVVAAPAGEDWQALAEQGSTAATVRILRELQDQRLAMKQNILALAEFTQKGFQAVAQKISSLEGQMGTQTAGNLQLEDFTPQGDMAMLPDTVQTVQMTNRLANRYRHTLPASMPAAVVPYEEAPKAKTSVSKIARAIMAANRLQGGSGGQLYVINSMGDMLMVDQAPVQPGNVDMSRAVKTMMAANKIRTNTNKRRQQAEQVEELPEELPEPAAPMPKTSKGRPMSRTARAILEYAKAKRAETVSATDIAELQRCGLTKQEIANAAKTMMLANKMKANFRAKKPVPVEEEYEEPEPEPRANMEQWGQDEEEVDDDMMDFYLGGGDEALPDDPETRARKAGMLKNRMKYKSTQRDDANVPNQRATKDFKQFRKTKRRELYTPSFPSAQAEPAIQFMFKGADGRVTSANVVAEEQYQAASSSGNGGSSTNAMAQSTSNPLEQPAANVSYSLLCNDVSHKYVQFEFVQPAADQLLPSSSKGRRSQDSNRFMSQAPQGSKPSMHCDHQSLIHVCVGDMMKTQTMQTVVRSLVGSPARSSALNRDFMEVMERGSLEDVGRLLDNNAPKPELLSASARNRLYDIISTLLQQGKHVERSLVWVLALVRGHDHMMYEVAGHTKKDMQEALQRLAQEPSKRGLLASLLNAQLKKQLAIK